LLHERIIQIKRLSDFHTSWPVQRVLARFLQSGLLETHIRRMRRHYAEKRALVTTEFESIGALARPRGFDAGLHVFIELAPQLPHALVARRAYEADVCVTTIDDYFYGRPTLNGILLGYGGLTNEQVQCGSRILVDVIRQLAAEGRSAA
jgi:GntR family transcriptional regulator/MocR family aminotransferase